MAGPSGRKRSKTIRPRFNVCTLYDHMTGRYVQGKDGLWYLNGGHPHIQGYAGRGNTFKSALSGTFTASMSLRYNFEYTEFYDSEMSMQMARIQDYINSIAADHHWVNVPQIADLMEDDITTWNFTASDEQSGDEWWNSNCRAEVPARRKLTEKQMRKTPFKNIDGSYVSVPNPWAFTVDSLSEFHTNAQEKKAEKGTIGESDMNTSAMDDARHKSQLLAQMPNVAAQGGYYFGLIAHADDELKMDQYAPSTKKLDGLKGNLKLKGVPGRGFTFLTNGCLLATAIESGLNKSDKKPEYPHPDIEAKVGDSDLRIITYAELRGKAGPTGAELKVAFSQREGMLFGVTNFIFLKDTCNGFGINSSGNGGGIKELQLYPGFKFTRKDLRKHLRDDPKFTRAMAITTALAFMQTYWFDLPEEERITPDELRQGVIDNGWDWDNILSNTVEYWYFEDQAKEIGKPTITAKTLIYMALGKLNPKCLPKNKKD